MVQESVLEIITTNEKFDESIDDFENYVKCNKKPSELRVVTKKSSEN